MTVTRCSLSEIPKLVPLFDSYRSFYSQTSDVTGAKAFLTQRIEGNESVVFVALDDSGHAVGFTQLYPLFSSVSMKRIWLLNDLFVVEGSRKQGIGEALLNKAKEFAEKSGAGGILLETGTENVNAQKLYEKLGYRRNTETYFYFLKVF